MGGDPVRNYTAFQPGQQMFPATTARPEPHQTSCTQGNWVAGRHPIHDPTFGSGHSDYVAKISSEPERAGKRNSYKQNRELL